MNKPLPVNTFFDINKLPQEKGLLLFGLSMNKLSNRQNAEHCIEDIRRLGIEKVSKPLIGLNFIYSDYLYLYDSTPAAELKYSFMNQVIDHKNSVGKLLEKNSSDLQIQHAFNYLVWNQLYLGAKDFNAYLKRTQALYQQDSKFKEYILGDCKDFDKEPTENQVNFFLEEILMFYLMSKSAIRLPNDYIQDQQTWVLFCYPGKPLKSVVYFYQLNPFDLDWPENPYQSAHYDLESKKLIEFNRVDLNTF